MTPAAAPSRRAAPRAVARAPRRPVLRRARGAPLAPSSGPASCRFPSSRLLHAPPSRRAHPQGRTRPPRRTQEVTVLFVDVQGSTELAGPRPRRFPQRHGRRIAADARRRAPLGGAPSTSSPATASWRSSARRSPTRTMPGALCRRVEVQRALADYAVALRREQGPNVQVRFGLNSDPGGRGHDR